jgi:hypothetical protein
MLTTPKKKKLSAVFNTRVKRGGRRDFWMFATQKNENLPLFTLVTTANFPLRKSQRNITFSCKTQPRKGIRCRRADTKDNNLLVSVGGDIKTFCCLKPPAVQISFVKK